MDHPAIERAMHTGYPYSERRQMFGEDGLANDVHVGDEILKFDGEFYRVEDLSVDAIEILEKHGADYEIAK
ncbi:hypothetical protein GCM10011346_52070 [Oceanobacillus neutriphilus]|uniref:YqaI-like protein n=2 Tax=Oceanobacillus neutriphilus TaxID=531815 RepID=A0ABQ2P3U2_9BACI|nr:hypothetical protein GCM10011346_52070 [Oceanobacillus neutriphilus]